MIDREYLKFNTSINTATNSGQGLTRDAAGNIAASIELLLPDDLFRKKDGNKRVSSVAMQTSKFRLSLEHTPIAQLDLDREKMKDNFYPTSCQLDVYPYCLLDDNQIQPPPPGTNGAFPNYKNHKVQLTLVYYDYTDPNNPVEHSLDVFNFQSNTKGYGFPEASRFYPILKQAGVLEKFEHCLNLCVQSNHEPYTIEGDHLMIYNLGTLTQLLQDAIENAITFASTEDYLKYTVKFVDISTIPAGVFLSPPLRTDITMTLEENGKTICFWDMVKDDDSTLSSTLRYAVKQLVNIGPQSISISYDSIPFNAHVPIVWNTAYINTFDHPEQLTIDSLRDEIWHQPPPKRVYQYGVNNTSSSFSYTLPNDISCAAMNIICNKAMKDVFSFLPWIPVDISQVSTFNNYGQKTTVTFTSQNTTSTDLRQKTTVTCDAGNYEVTQHTKTMQGDTINGHPALIYSYRWYADADPFDRSSYFNQAYSWGRLTDNSQGTVMLPITDATPVPITNYVVSPTTEKVYEKYTEYGVNLTPGTTVLDSGENDTYTEEWNRDREYNGEIIIYTSYINGSTVTNIGYPMDGHWAHSAISLPATPQSGKIETLHDDVERPYYDVYSWWYLEPVDDLTYISPTFISIHWTGLEAEGNRYRNTIQWEHEHISYSNSKTVEVSDTDQSNTRMLTLPNLDMTDNTFYILDGTTSEVEISQPEPIQIGGSVDPDVRFRIDTVTTYEDYSRTRLLTYSHCMFTRPSWDYPEERYESYSDMSHITDNDQDYIYQILVVSYRYRTYDSPDQWYQISAGPLSSHHSMDIIYHTPIISSEGAWSDYQLINSRDSPETTYSTENLTPGTYVDPPDIYEHPSELNREPQSPGSSTVYREVCVATNLSTFSSGDIANVMVGAAGGETTYNQFIYEFVPLTSVDPSLVYHDPEVTPLSGWLDAYPPVNYSIDFGSSHPEDDPSATEVERIWFLKVPFNDQNYNNYSISYQTGTTREETQLMDKSIKTTTITDVSTPGQPATYQGNVRLSYTWNNLPMVVMSPIQSFVLTLQGMQINNEYQPVNMTTTGGSSLTATITIIENYYSLAQTLHDLHDELVVVKEQFDDTATYTVAPTSGQERSLKIQAQYITKDGRLHQVYIPPNGVFSLQLTFGISYYTV